MEKPMKKRLDLSRIDPRKAGALAIVGALALLIILLCISISSRAHMQSEYTDARNEIGEALYTELYMLCQTFDQVAVPGAEVQDVIIPGMRDCYLSGQALNTALKNAFGNRYAVLSENDIAALDAAFEAYDAAFRSGKPTDDAQAAMQACIDNVRAILLARYPSGTLKAA